MEDKNLKYLLKDMVEAHGEGLYKMAFRYTGDHHAAEDIVQETFLRALRNLERYDRNRPAGPWLYRIALNLCRNRAARRREYPEEVESKLEKCSGEGMTESSNPEKMVLQQEGEQELTEIIGRLPEKYRAPLILKHVNQMSYQEICNVLGWQLSLVKNRLYRGRMMLKAELMKRGEQNHETLP